MDAVKRKDIGAYNRLVSDHQDLVYNFAYYVLCDEKAAISATEQAFLKAFHKLDKYKDGPFRFWLLRNLIEICQSKIKGEPKYSGHIKQPVDASIPFASLLPQLRMALVLIEMEGLNYEQAAELTGSSPHKIAQQLSKARQQLSLSNPG